MSRGNSLWEPFHLDAPVGADEFFATVALCDAIPSSDGVSLGGLGVFGGISVLFNDFMSETTAYKFANTLVFPKKTFAKLGRDVFERELELGITFIDDKATT